MTQYLYLIKCREFYKIGIANDVQSRLAQLSTGNPFELEAITVSGFDNAASVEAVLHQRFASKRRRGEWFELSAEDVTTIDKIILLLCGSGAPDISGVVDEEEIKEAEKLSVPTDGAKWDYAAMFADGWQIQTQDGRGLYWVWRKRRSGEDKAIYGGAVSELPCSMDELRRVYRDGEEPREERKTS